MYMRKKFRLNYFFFSDLETDFKPLKASLKYKNDGAHFAVVLKWTWDSVASARERSDEQCWTALGLLALGRSHTVPI